MKRLLLVLLLISLFVFSCEDNNVVDTTKGVKLEWIGFGGQGNDLLQYIWYVGTKPSFPSSGVLTDSYDIGWDNFFECDEIELF